MPNYRISLFILSSFILSACSFGNGYQTAEQMAHGYAQKTCAEIANMKTWSSCFDEHYYAELENIKYKNPAGLGLVGAQNGGNKDSISPELGEALVSLADTIQETADRRIENQPISCTSTKTLTGYITNCY